MPDHRYYIDMAADLCKKSNVKSFQHGAILVGTNGKVISTGWNHYVMPNLEKITEKGTLHAERHAIIKALWKKKDIRGATLYVARINKCGDFRISKPCSDCEKQIRKHEVGNIYYSVSEPEQ